MVHLVLDGGGQATVNVVELVSSCTYVSRFITPFSTCFIPSFSRLEIIGRVAFDHNFTSADAAEINRAWQNHVNKGLTFSGFIAPLLLRTFPYIVKLPIPIFQAQGTTKTIVDRLTKDIIQEGTINENGSDILTLLIKANRGATRGNRLSDEQLVANVTTFM